MKPTVESLAAAAERAEAALETARKEGRFQDVVRLEIKRDRAQARAFRAHLRRNMEKAR